MTLISHRYKFAFVHVYKAGGTSVTRALIAYARLRERLAVNSPYGRKLFYAVNELQYLASGGSVPAGTSSWYMGLSKHATFREVLDFLGPQKSHYKVFTVLRNPLEWVASQYSYIRQRPLHSLHQQVKSQSFNDFVAQFIDERRSLQTDMIKSHDSGRKIDCIVQLESFDSVSPDLFEFLGIPDCPSSLQRLNTSSRSSPNLPSAQLSMLQSYLMPDLELYQRLCANRGIIFNSPVSWR